jgi:hypothetical protein
MIQNPKTRFTLSVCIEANHKAEEEFHTRVVDSSSRYFKPDHDVIMTLSENARRVAISTYLSAREEPPRRKK